MGLNTDRIKSLTVGRTYNLGNYESLRLEVTVDVYEDDDVNQLRIDAEKKLDTLRGLGRDGQK